MKKNICRICSVCLLVAMLFLTGCSGSGFFDEETVQIADIVAEPMPEIRQTRLTIKYVDDVREPFVDYIPWGEDGETGKVGATGNGIEKITFEHDAKKRQTQAVISFTDEEAEDISFNIPDGKSVIGVESGVEEATGAHYVIFRYNDETVSDPIYLPKGEKGNGIKTYNYTLNEDKSVVIDFTFDEGKPLNIVIPPPQDGNGIETMVGREEGEFYCIDVTYTNGEKQQLKFERPAKWYSGTYLPIDSFGADGDFFFDTEHEKIYSKESGSWNVVVDFKIEKYKVTFDLNDEGDASMPSANNVYKVERGSYFSADGNGDIPIPTRPGYKFMGWYTKRVINPATMSPFTDFTPVFSDLTLYAIWEEI